MRGIDSEYTKGIMLDEESFKCLVSGGVVHSGKIRIALSDIGFDRMQSAILDAMIEAISEFPKTHNKDYIKDDE